MPRYYSYGQYSSSNYGTHTLAFEVGGLTVYFSYDTPVAFRGRDGLKVRKNVWGTTTGKHLNWIDGGSEEEREKRIDGEIFEELLEAEINGVTVPKLY